MPAGPHSRGLPELRGVVHAAGVLDDGIIAQLDQKSFETVMAPKLSGTWNLHELTADSDWYDQEVTRKDASGFRGNAAGISPHGAHHRY